MPIAGKAKFDVTKNEIIYIPEIISDDQSSSKQLVTRLASSKEFDNGTVYFTVKVGNDSSTKVQIIFNSNTDKN